MILNKIVQKIKSRKKKTEKGENWLNTKKEMCKKSIQSGVCPHACDICAWNTFE